MEGLKAKRATWPGGLRARSPKGLGVSASGQGDYVVRGSKWTGEPSNHGVGGRV